MMAIKGNRIAAYALCGAMAFASAVAYAYTSASYVQDGLIAQWDGIDNTGMGVHDPDAKVWKDLAGNYDLTLLPKGAWSGEGNALVVNGAAAVCSNSLPAYKTIEVVYKMSNPKGQILFASGGTSQVNDFHFIVFNRSGETSGTTGYFSGAWKVPAPHVIWDSFDPAAVRSMAATYNNGEAYAPNGNVAAVYADGVARSDGSADSAWGLGDGHIMIGDRAEAGAYPWFGEVYTIRVYSRALSAEEIAANHAIDVARFYAPPQDEGYVTDGLVARWDGIDNAGTGTHNPNATVWKDLAGNLDLTLSCASSWTGGNALKLDNGGYAFNDDRAPEYKTIEVVFKMTDVTGRIIFNSGYANRVCIVDGSDISGNLTAKVYFDGSNVATPCIDQKCNYSETCFMSARYDDNGAVTELRRDGEVRTDSTITKNWDVGTKTIVGCRQGYSYYGYWMGEIYSIRLYDRRLTKWELAHNNRIDRKRFLTSGSYIQRGLAQQWDGIDNAGRGVHDSSATTWKNLVSGGLDLTVKPSGRWADNALACLGTGIAAQNEANHLYYETLEIVFRNRKAGTSAMVFSGGSGIGRFCALGANYTMWHYRHSSRDFTNADIDPVSLTWVSSQNVYSDGSPMQFEIVEDTWNAGTDTIQVGDRMAGTSYPFTGDIYAIRTYYSTQLTAYEIAYNAKVDDARFFTPNGGQSLTWKGPDGALSDGVFGSNGCWKVTERPKSRAIPTIGDRVSLPAGDYTVTLDEQTWSLGSLYMGAGAKLKMALPTGTYDADKAIVTVSGGVAVEATAGLVLEKVAAFCAAHSREKITLLSCGVDSTAVLRNIANAVNATLPCGKVAVVNGTELVFKAPGGTIISIR